jgi:hypothetical protein
MTIKKALASLTPEQLQKIMQCFNEVEALTILLEDNLFLSVHTKPERPFDKVEDSTYWLLGKFK